MSLALGLILFPRPSLAWIPASDFTHARFRIYALYTSSDPFCGSDSLVATIPFDKTVFHQNDSNASTYVQSSADANGLEYIDEDFVNPVQFSDSVPMNFPTEGIQCIILITHNRAQLSTNGGKNYQTSTQVGDADHPWTDLNSDALCNAGYRSSSVGGDSDFEPFATCQEAAVAAVFPNRIQQDFNQYKVSRGSAAASAQLGGCSGSELKILPIYFSTASGCDFKGSSFGSCFGNFSSSLGFNLSAPPVSQGDRFHGVKMNATDPSSEYTFYFDTTELIGAMGGGQFHDSVGCRPGGFPRFSLGTSPASSQSPNSSQSTTPFPIPAPLPSPSGQNSPTMSCYGNVMTGTSTIWLLYYGNWDVSDAEQLRMYTTLNAFVSDLVNDQSVTSYLNVVKSYGASASLAFNFETNVRLIPSDGNLSLITQQNNQPDFQTGLSNVVSSIGSFHGNEIIFIIPSKDLRPWVPGMHSSFLGRFGNEERVKYAIASAGDYLWSDPFYGPIFQRSYVTPNGRSADLLIRVFLHELVETLSDPVGGWVADDGIGSEIADLCGNSLHTNTGADSSGNAFSYNMEINGHKYDVDSVAQKNNPLTTRWISSGGTSYPAFKYPSQIYDVPRCAPLQSWTNDGYCASDGKLYRCGAGTQLDTGSLMCNRNASLGAVVNPPTPGPDRTTFCTLSYVPY